MTMQQFDPLIFEDFFETNALGRQALFQSILPGSLQGRQREQANQLFTPTFNQFLGGLGQSLRSGRTPQSFQDFVTNDFNLTRGLAQLPDQQTPGLTSRATFGF